MTAIRRSPTAGFTLIEIMVVLVIVGVMLAMFTLSMGSFNEDDAREHVRRLEALLNLAADEASIQGREIGLRFYQHGYEFSVRQQMEDKDGNRRWVWLPEQDDNFLRPRDLGEDITVDLEIDGKELTLAYEADGKKDYKPQIYVFSAGGIEPAFTVRLRPSFERRGVTLSVTADGSIEWLDDEN
jgi:general secretion pathway protein H